ncbi:MAG: ribonuclease P protein component [Cyclobacteriaceae bacterium]|nr:ribonuclease P protein component [Cyclobacteriaceae bacterium]MCH8516591.1 ribonuclease P protein component [Cyclobacteriaceae bacterium]
MNKLPKSSILRHKKDITLLFKNGDGLFQHPFKCSYICQNTESAEFKVLFSVSKRNFKRAVDRNHIKRIMRESFRQNRQSLHRLVHDHRLKLNLSFVYIHKQIEAYSLIDAKIKKMLHRLEMEVNAKMLAD